MSTNELRALAQAHLQEIEEEKAAEAERQTKAEQELQKYVKVKTKDRPRRGRMEEAAAASSAETFEEVVQGKGPRLRSAEDVLDRLRWDPSIDLAHYTISYLERFEGIKEMPASSWIRESTKEDFIPLHRIRHIKRTQMDGQQEIVWDRDTKIDLVFGSGGTAKDNVEQDQSKN